MLPSAGGWQRAGAVAAAELFRNDVLVARGTAPAGGALPADSAGLAVEGADVFVSAIRKVTAADGAAGTEVRLVAMSDTGVHARLIGAFTEAATVDLLGRPLSGPAAAPGALGLDLGPWEIRTVLLR